ncbi:hypothetical protein A5678_10975 [Mycobacterium sp. E2733]|nr:hypothetical protein A5678_10975 [Mycobacterium sp. E2733]
MVGSILVALRFGKILGGSPGSSDGAILPFLFFGCTVHVTAATLRRGREGQAMARPFAAPATVFNARITERRNIA